MAESLGQAWYAEFVLGFLKYAETEITGWERDWSESKWTTCMNRFLNRLAGAMRFKVIAEQGEFGKKRTDHFWKREDETIAIEHENAGIVKAIKEELPKLVRVKATLRVCITYVPDSHFPGTRYMEECGRLMTESALDGEMLLVLGSYSMNSPSDWVCHRFFPSIKSEILAIPSSVVLVPPRSVKRR